MPRREQHLKLGHVQSDVCVGKVLPIRLSEELFENVINSLVAQKKPYRHI